MDAHIQQRGRSPSVGHQPDQPIRHSPSPNPFPDQLSPTDTSGNHLNYTSQAYNPSLSPTSGAGGPYGVSPSYLSANSSQPQFTPPSILPSNDYGDPSLGQAFGQENFDSSMQQGNMALGTQHPGQQFQADGLTANNFGGDFGRQQEFSDKQGGGQYFDGGLLDPQLSLNTQQQQDQSINPADLMSNMSSPQVMQPTPPNLLAPNSQHSEPTSPFTNPGQHWSPNHSRHASLDPNVAFVNGAQGGISSEWNIMQGPQFQGHRRTPSEHSDLGHSDVSSSVAPSPYMPQNDNFDQPSPGMRPQQDSQVYDNSLGMDAFTLSEPQNPNPRTSPGHSPYVSPMIGPQPGLGGVQESQFMLQPELQNNFNGASRDAFPNQAEQFPQFPPEARLGSNDYRQAGNMAGNMAPPEINVEFAGPQQSMMDRPRFESEFDGLSPPDRSKKSPINISISCHHTNNLPTGKRGRIRAKSDTYISRPVTPSSTAATLGSNDGSEHRGRSGSLSPFDLSTISPSYSRESSPAARSTSQRRSSTNSIPNRDYILELADPTRPSAPGTEKRIQKHPATFQCNLCPKNSPAPTTCAPTSAPTPTSAPSSAPCAPKPSRANTTASATRASTRARRNSSAAASWAQAGAGAAAAASPAPTPWAATSAPRPGASASSHCSTRRPSSASATWTTL